MCETCPMNMANSLSHQCFCSCSSSFGASLPLDIDYLYSNIFCGKHEAGLLHKPSRISSALTALYVHQPTIHRGEHQHGVLTLDCLLCNIVFKIHWLPCMCLPQLDFESQNWEEKIRQILTLNSFIGNPCWEHIWLWISI